VGPSVSLDDIARRAGVGAGTVHRHFPVKDELIKAVIADRLHELTGAAEGLADAADPGGAFVTFFHRLAADARQNLALSAALSGSADAGDAVRDAGRSLAAALGVLLTRAQRAGAIRADLDTADLHAIIGGALVIEQRLAPASQGRGLAVIVDGLRGARSGP
jgi:AcrR family transcriptional regulator